MWSILLILVCTVFINCQGSNDDDPIIDVVVENENAVGNGIIINPLTYKLPTINLSNWKVTLPIGSPTEVLPPAILNYGTNAILKPFFYNDSIKGAVVFYTYPGATTTNTSYSRTELREQMVPGSNST
ncbi:MAG: polysaccharide lyase family 7 protein, partial [Lutibacter sp.]|nr:polysaccharide lyase family 7 protein [Lutibacter sp.]